MLRLGKPNKKLISTNTGPGFPGFRIIGQKGPNYAGFRFLVSHGGRKEAKGLRVKKTKIFVDTKPMIS